MGTGSLVGSWPIPFSGFHLAGVCGDAYPSSYGASLWEITQNDGNNSYWVYQTDIDARGATNVLPASLGKVKAIYR
jgi:hypothetical protein